MEPESPNTHAPEFQTGCELACSTDPPDGARTHRLCDLEGLFFSPICSPSSHRAETPVLSQTAAVVETLTLTDTLTSLTDTPLCPTSPGLIYPRLNPHGGYELGPVARWSSPAWMGVWSAVRPCSIGSSLHPTTRRALDSPHLPSRALSAMPHECYGPHIACMMVSCLKSSCLVWRLAWHARVVDDPLPEDVEHSGELDVLPPKPHYISS